MLCFMKRNWKTLVREICKEACNQSGRSYEISFRLSDDKDLLHITFTPKIKKGAYVNLHILDIQKIEGLVYRRCRFIGVLDGEVELTFIR